MTITTVIGMTKTTDSQTTPASAGVVVLRHIPSNWQVLYVEPYEGRRKALCGRRVNSRLVGIPGITRQELEFQGRPGWCMMCIDAMRDWYINNYTVTLTSIPELRAAHNIVFFEMMRFMQFTIDNRDRLGLVAPESH